MAEFEEETYSTIFAALKHPSRRKILRLLSEKPRSFTEMQNLFKVESPYLTYHLDALKQLVSKTENGRYRLSAVGEAAMALMRGVEEAPKKPTFALPLKWKFLHFFNLFLQFILGGIAGLGYFYLIAYNGTTVSENINTGEVVYKKFYTTGEYISYSLVFIISIITFALLQWRFKDKKWMNYSLYPFILGIIIPFFTFPRNWTFHIGTIFYGFPLNWLKERVFYSLPNPPFPTAPRPPEWTIVWENLVVDIAFWGLVAVSTLYISRLLGSWLRK